jgi:hypothetical protein
VQYSPGTHCTAPMRTATSKASGVEYHPAGTSAGPLDPPGQYTVALPHGAAVLFMDPGGQKYPGRQVPEQALLSIPVTLPKRPAKRVVTQLRQPVSTR